MNARNLLPILFIGFAVFVVYAFSTMPSAEQHAWPVENNQMKDSVLRHVVLFKFKPNTSPAELEQIESAFAQLPSKIPEILEFEWGTNNSPEGLDKGFTHSFLVTFKNEEGRAVYLPHPDHKAFVELASPHIEDVLVVDYWAK